mgnify:CR=1 FL=1
MYGTVIEADNYLDESFWSSLPSSDKTKYLTRASEILDALNYVDQKAVSTQEHAFPRTNQTAIPEVVEQAAYYIAFELSQGFDEEREARTNTTVSVGKAGRGRPRRPVHIVAGVPSIRAWNLIFKYLRTPTFKVERIS